MDMQEIFFNVERDSDTGWLVAFWDDPAGGGITTQGRDLHELQDEVQDAVVCHFAGQPIPRQIRFHFVHDPVLITA